MKQLIKPLSQVFSFIKLHVELQSMDFQDFVDWLKGGSRREFLENLSYTLIVLAAVFSIVGISVGTFIPGFPVLLAILGAFLALVGIVLYVISEFVKILRSE